MHRNAIYFRSARTSSRQCLQATGGELSLKDRSYSLSLALALSFVVLLLIAAPLVRAQGQSTVTGPSPQPQTQSPEELPAGSPARGKELFSGQVHFQNGGPPCASCHSIAGLSFPNGGTLGPNLTHEYSKLGPEGTTIVLKTLYFPAMSPIYDSRPLTPQEQADLQAFLKEASASTRTPSETLTIAVAGLLGFFVLLIVTRAVWRGRLRSVRHRLLEKARAQGGLQA